MQPHVRLIAHNHTSLALLPRSHKTLTIAHITDTCHGICILEYVARRDFSLTSLITGTLFKATLLFLVVTMEYVYMMYHELYNNAKYTQTVPSCANCREEAKSVSWEPVQRRVL
jgi:hypothetical protein